MELKMFYEQNGQFLEKVQEPALKLTHWDFVIKEMVFLFQELFFLKKFKGNIGGIKEYK